MKNTLKTLVAVVALGAMVAATAQTTKPATIKPAAKKANTMTCPSCHMAMGMKKTKATPVAIKTKKGTYYCCADCASGKAALKAAKKPAPKPKM